jgi:MFS family permease
VRLCLSADAPTYPTFRHSPGLTTALLTFVLVANLIPLMGVPTVLPNIQSEWHLSASQVGWVGGIYFAGYAVAAPILSGAADRIDGRWVLAGSSVLGAAASFAFGAYADGFWLALVLRFVSGVAVAGIHMPGLKMLADRMHGPAQVRGAAIYTSSYALGNAASALIAGIASSMFDWRAPFVAGGVGALLAIPALAFLPSGPVHGPVRVARAGFGSLLRNRGLMAYTLGFAGNTWEVFAVRVWFVSCLSWTLHLPGNDIALPNLGIVSGLAALLGVPVSIAVAELAVRCGRPAVIMVTCLISVLVCLALAMTAGGNILIVLPLLVLLQVTSFADVGALSAGAIAATTPFQRGSALGFYAMVGFSSGFLGPTVTGFVIGHFGGVASAAGWAGAFATMGLGSAVAGWAVWYARSMDTAEAKALS